MSGAKETTLTSAVQIGFMAYIPPNPPGTYLSFILKSLGFSTFNANLLAIPSQFMFLINVSLQNSQLLISVR